ncbi:MFS transporter [Pelagibacterium lacus]|uniref:MFS transporter n=1 Tax=Pelagibacterium lacus TaxID=2282655 RepID=A0A369W586_9HYPH|nr:MFS transporter [Pelagibacterium lacus]RDE09728.1 MFS transporter [Pelagibacterium lacus]
MPPTSSGIERNSPDYWRASIALFLAAFSVFASVYSVQPILPLLATEFDLDAATSSFAVSATTGTLAVSLVVVSWLGNRFDRKSLMMATMVATALIGLAIPMMQAWWPLVGLRALLGVAVCGVPAIAMVYLAEEMSTEALGFGMGLFIGGSAMGGMAGRLLVGFLADHFDWRIALFALSAVVVVNAILFFVLLPAPRRSATGTLTVATFAANVADLFKDKALPLLFLAAFLLMGGFVAIYNYIGFRLLAPPYSLSQSQVSLIFIVYLVGTLGSAWMGALAGRLGRRRVFWPMVVVTLSGIVLTLVSAIWAVVFGIAVMTFGFFAAHSIASAWVARRAQTARAQGSAIYLLAYYAGSSVIGTFGGYGWSHGGWPGVVAIAGGAILVTLAIAWQLYRIPPILAPDRPPQPPQGI